MDFRIVNLLLYKHRQLREKTDLRLHEAGFWVVLPPTALCFANTEWIAQSYKASCDVVTLITTLQRSYSVAKSCHQWLFWTHHPQGMWILGSTPRAWSVNPHLQPWVPRKALGPPLLGQSLSSTPNPALPDPVLWLMGQCPPVRSNQPCALIVQGMVGGLYGPCMGHMVAVAAPLPGLQWGNWSPQNSESSPEVNTLSIYSPQYCCVLTVAFWGWVVKTG